MRQLWRRDGGAVRLMGVHLWYIIVGFCSGVRRQGVMELKQQQGRSYGEGLENKLK